MNKTRKNKYLRKNRHGKNSKHKHKTRKVQRGGGGDPPEEEAAPVANKTPTAEANATSPEYVENLLKKANDKNIREQESNPELVALAKSPSNIIKSFFLNLFESKKKELPTALAIDNLTSNISKIIDENDKNLDIVNTVGDAIRKHIRDIIYNNKNLSHDDSDKNLSDDARNKLIVLIGDLKRVGEIAKEIANSSTELAIAGTTDGKLNHGPVQPPGKTVDTSEKPSLTQRFNQGVSNMGKKVKNAAIYAKDAVTSRFSRKKKSDNEDTEKEIELQELSTDKLKEAAQTEPTPTPTEPIKTSTETPNNEGRLAKVRTALSNFKDRITRKNRETTYSRLPNNDNTKTNEVSQPQPQVQPQGGGNKTRKNRQHQYIHEIKKNRNELFNKEMEIINSIRNFKHGHIDNDNDNTKKQFMNAVKRG